ncbi:hypothetical protein BD779DRAFT_261270 [Infundibulicybe gibba]|nr:hypothetical protein BD779DRAFT_261270 [Infundibulicybe gibba]
MEATLLQNLVDVQLTNYLVAAAATLVVFDYILTVQQEVALIWRSPWNPTSLLYIWNRYYTLIILAIDLSFMFRVIDSDKVCNKYQTFQNISGVVLVVTIDVILALRVWILYEKNRRLLWFFAFFISAELIAMTIVAVEAEIMTVASGLAIVRLGPYPKLVGCSLTTNNALHILSFYSTPAMIVSFVMFLMTIYRCIFRNNQIGIPILNLFLRDGVFWFLATLLVLPPEIVLTALPLRSRALSGLMLMPGFAMYSLIGSRVLLNIKAFLATDVVSGTSTANETFGDQTTEFRAATRHTNVTTNTRDDPEA